MNVLDNIPVRFDVDDVLELYHLEEGDAAMQAGVRELVERAQAAARPRAGYEVRYIERRTRDSLIIEGQRFTSRILRLNIKNENRVFPFVATCGAELDALRADDSDILLSFILDHLKTAAVRAAIAHLEDHLTRIYLPGALSHMSPGDLDDWPLLQQRPLFSLLGDTQGTVGVTLTESCLMVPVKSVSGICFASEVRFDSCRLCPREPCDVRRAPYDTDLVESYRAQM